jgi:hypothetical protein
MTTFGSSEEEPAARSREDQTTRGTRANEEPTMKRCEVCGGTTDLFVECALDMDSEEFIECYDCIAKDVMRTKRQNGRPFLSYDDVQFDLALSEGLGNNWEKCQSEQLLFCSESPQQIALGAGGDSSIKRRSETKGKPTRRRVERESRGP